MLVFNKKKVVYDFYNKHKAFLYWYLKKYSNVPEKLYYLLMQYIVEYLMEDIEELICYDEQQQRKWIIEQIEDFSAKK